MAKQNKSVSNEKHIAINTQNFIWLFLVLLLAWLSVICFSEGSVIMGIVFALIAGVGVFVLVISSAWYEFTEESVTIVYFLGDRETIPWRSVRSITLFGSWLSKGSGSPHYYIAYGHDDIKKFYVNGEIMKTMRTKKLISIYYHGKIV